MIANVGMVIIKIHNLYVKNVKVLVKLANLIMTYVYPATQIYLIIKITIVSASTDIIKTMHNVTHVKLHVLNV